VRVRRWTKIAKVIPEKNVRAGAKLQDAKKQGTKR
jgi:hypothetical protein